MSKLQLVLISKKNSSRLPNTSPKMAIINTNESQMTPVNLILIIVIQQNLLLQVLVSSLILKDFLVPWTYLFLRPRNHPRDHPHSQIWSVLAFLHILQLKKK